MALAVHYFRPTDDPADNGGGTTSPYGGFPLPGEDLPYKVELWDGAGDAVEQTLAVSANASIGFAAYYAAVREYPGRNITLRHKGGVICRWNARAH